ncbi:hypothetical protein PInf_004704 [Phytophthora infestans]|nr:hypothetical protein PInf_004704 [Phytophthora infestans]
MYSRCDEDKLAESLYHTRVTDIHELEEVIEDVLKGKERMAKRDSEYRHSKSRDATMRPATSISMGSM